LKRINFEQEWELGNKFGHIILDESKREKIKISQELIDDSKKFIDNGIINHEKRKKLIRDSKYPTIELDL
jgi:hypothetical protein